MVNLSKILIQLILQNRPLSQKLAKVDPAFKKRIDNYKTFKKIE